MKSLDDRSLYPKLDPTNLRERLRAFPQQCRNAWEEAMSFDLPREYGRVRRVVVLGMGGSAIGGDLLADLTSLDESLPITVCRDYHVPGYVDEDTLALACSYSGETEETLSSFREALSKRAKVVAITSGGTLGREAKAKGLPTFIVGYEGEPRSSLGYGFTVPTALLVKLGLVSDKERDFREAMEVLDEMSPELGEESPTEKNPAKEMASLLAGRLIVVYGAGYFSSVARRWKTQFNENSKAWAFFELLPEAHHNSVVGYSQLPGVPGYPPKERVFAVLLKPGTVHPRTALRYRITQDLLEGEGIPHRTLEGRGRGGLGQILGMVYLGDYTSYYLAILQGIDPSPVSNIDYIKEQLSSAG
jgi:glucose/mannose-6-phosphate isomerase